jgi:general secretion pathway protein G
MSRSYRIIIAVCIGAALFLAVFMGMPDLGPNSAARKAAAQTDISDIIRGLGEFRVDYGRYPTTEEGLAALIKRPLAIPAAQWRHAYLDMDRIPEDPWGRRYIYECPGKHHPDGFDVYSLGPNGKGGEEAIGNWMAP